MTPVPGRWYRHKQDSRTWTMRGLEWGWVEACDQQNNHVRGSMGEQFPLAEYTRISCLLECTLLCPDRIDRLLEYKRPG